MRMIQSFWTKPSLPYLKASDDNRINGGWRQSKYQYYSWALSCLRAVQCFGEVDLVTDEAGKFLLVDKLRLPYKNVSISLEKIQHYPQDLWALGKIYCYSIQEKPFIHFDNDVFFWRKLKAFKKASLVAQNFEANLDFYQDGLNLLAKSQIKIPPQLGQGIDKNIYSSNAGVIGGNNLNFFKELGEIVFDFIDKNNSKLNDVRNLGLINVIIEQLFFHRLARNKELNISYLIKDENPNTKSIISFHKTPLINRFIHVVGKKSKKDPIISNNIELLLRTEFPDYYFNINKLVENTLL
jgi:hypothetical protein